jgi:bla regulator protein BlaR1
LYGLWIDNKKVPNTALNNYQNTDFAHAFVSKLAKNIANDRKYHFQVNLMTIDEYRNYLKTAVEKKDDYQMGFRLNNPGRKTS